MNTTMTTPSRLIAGLALVLAVAACGGGVETADPADEATTASPTSIFPSVDAEATTAAEPSDALNGVRLDVRRVAPGLERYYRGGDYPRDLADVIASLEPAEIELTEGNRLAGYRYNADQVEFTLCVEHESGAWATYDTRPMSLQESAETGGCPAL